MDEGLAKLIGLAWKTVPARDANLAIARARRATSAGEEALARGLPPGQESEAAADDEEAPLARSYELVLDAGATFERFAREQLPRMVYHLESLGAHLPHAPGVVVCVFEGDDLHFLQAGELIAAVCAQLGITAEELVKRYGTGESRTARRGPPLGLPGPAPEGSD